jgi:hypothetical protein
VSVRLQGPDGKVYDVPDEAVDHAISAQGFKPIGGTAAAADFETSPAPANTVADKAAAGISSGLSTATFGLSDYVTRLTATDGELEALRRAKEENTGAVIAGTLAGVVVDPFGAAGAASKIGKTLARTEQAVTTGGKIARAAGAGVIEGGVFGLGTGAGELALDSHPLNAEHIASTLSSNILMGAGAGGIASGAFKAGEVALERASLALERASQARRAIQGVPEDLAHLDDAGLRDALSKAKADHAADIAAEKKSLEQLRVEKRAELASQVKDFHTELATERPIFQAVAGEDIRKVANVGTEVASPLNKSYRSLRAAFDNPIAIAENPSKLLAPLQMQQTALESLQAKMPDLHAAFAGDARLAALEHVDGALEQNKAFQDVIRSIDKSNPLTGSRLTALESGPSQRMIAIEQARDALKNAPELGLLAKGAKGGAFAGATALAHMIPGVGIAAPFLGKAASDFVGIAMGRLTNASRAVAEKSAATVKAFLNTAEKVEKFVPVTATKVLSSVKFAANALEPKSQKLHDLYAARSAELRQQTMYAPDGSVQMRPEARMAMAKRLDPIRAVNPILADQIETTAARKIAYMSSKLPRRPEVGGIQIGPDNWRPSDMQMRSWARTVRACENPDGVEERLLHGNMTPEDAEAYRNVFPERFMALRSSIEAQLPLLAKTLPMKRKIALSVFVGVPLIPALQPNVLAVLQGNFASEPGTAGGTQAPAAQPHFGALGSLKSSDKPTPAQAREGA